MEKLFDILEFNKIKDLILKHNINELSRKKVNELQPLFFDEVVSELLDQTKEAYKLVNLGTFPSLGQVTDLTSSLEKVSKNGVLDLQEIYDFVINLSVNIDELFFKKLFNLSLISISHFLILLLILLSLLLA